MKSELEIGSYKSVDQASDPRSYIATMDIMDQQPLVREAREIMRRALSPMSGDVILDLGCGTGTEARALAERVGPQGRVIGVDGSEAMVNEARRRAQQMNLPLDFQHGDAAALVFKDGTFSGCRAERLFQHLSDPRGAIAELVRVSRSGACIAVSDADWGSATLDAPNKSVTRRILNCFCDSVSNGWIGRQHPALFKSAGLIDVQVHPQVWIYRRYEDLDRWGFSRTLENAVAMKVISAEEKDELVAHLIRADRDDSFFYSVTGFVVSGVKR